MSNDHSTKPVRAVAYYRMSTENQEDSIPQQQGAMRPRANLAGVEIVREFGDDVDLQRDGTAAGG
jgi:DNA invertase Pin-like site-specific DNA recombinase